MRTDRVPKGLALLKGFSVFNPDDAFVEEFKETWGVKLDFLDKGENLLWMGAPDFRYSLLSFGQPVLKFYMALIAFVLIPAVIVSGSWINPIFISAFILFSLLFIVVFLSASIYFGIICVRKNRIVIMYVECLPRIITEFTMFNLRKAKSTTRYYDIGYINDMHLINSAFPT